MPDITTTRIFQDAEKGITAQKLNDIVASSVIQPAFYTTKPTASTADPADIALIVKSGAYAQVPVSTLSSGVSNAQITNVRLRSFNAIRNPSFEVDQRNYGAAVVPATGTAPFGPDRWSFSTAFGAARNKIQQINANVVVPGTSFNITQKICRITLTTKRASIAATDYFTIQQGN